MNLLFVESEWDFFLLMLSSVVKISKEFFLEFV